MEALSVFFNSHYFEYLLQLVPVSFLLGSLLIFCSWALGMGFAYFVRILRS